MYEILSQEEEQDSCLVYDSRIRPWYNGAITYPNHLVILVDNGHSMADTLLSTGALSDTKLLVAQTLSLALLSTTYENNYINVFSFGGAQNDIYTQSVRASPCSQSDLPCLVSCKHGLSCSLPED